ncbi:MAG TPA: GNAT family N-acetyltransferase [bacterium]|nr:GNAT family N-acetyltransferase [bacterium]
MTHAGNAGSGSQSRTPTRDRHPQPGITGLVIRPLHEHDLSAADRILRLAFGTFVGHPDPPKLWPGKDYIRTRWLADPSAAFGAELDGELVGSNFAARWGSVGSFGPLTVHPDRWDQGVARRLLDPVVALFARWGTAHAGLFTFPHSPKHIHLYQKFDFWPRYLTAIMSKSVTRLAPVRGSVRYSELSEHERGGQLAACRELADAIYPGLDLEREICAVQAQGLGDTLLARDDAGLLGFAVCHCGVGTEAGDGACYVKFAATRPGPTAAQRFDGLLEACETFAAARNLTRLVGGVNLARHEAYRRMIARGFRTDFQGVTMHLPNDPGYDRPDVFLIDDWR